MSSVTDPSPAEDGRALDGQLSVLETGVYRSLIGVAEACQEIAARADELGLMPQSIRAWSGWERCPCRAPA